LETAQNLLAMLSTFRLPCLAAVVQCAMVMLLLTILTEGRAQNITVTFNVNMASVTDPDVPHVAGGSDFGVPGDNPMSDPDGREQTRCTLPFVFFGGCRNQYAHALDFALPAFASPVCWGGAERWA